MFNINKNRDLNLKTYEKTLTNTDQLSWTLYITRSTKNVLFFLIIAKIVRQSSQVFFLIEFVI